MVIRARAVGSKATKAGHRWRIVYTKNMGEHVAVVAMLWESKKNKASDDDPAPMASQLQCYRHHCVILGYRRIFFSLNQRELNEAQEGAHCLLDVPRLYQR